MSPPKLTGNTPVFYIFHPTEVNFGEALRNKLDLSVFDDFDRGFGERFHLDEPLLGNDRLNAAVATIAFADVMFIGLFFHEKAESVEVFFDFLSCRHTVKSRICFTRKLVHRPVVVHNANDFEVVAHSDFKVVRIVCRRDFNRAATEVGLDVFVRNDWDLSVRQRQIQGFSDKIHVSFVARVNGDSRIAEHRFGTRRRDRYIAASVRKRIFDVPQKAVLFRVFDFRVGKGGFTARTPVDNPASAINQPFIIEIHEHSFNGFIAFLIHRKGFAGPVQRRPELL